MKEFIKEIPAGALFGIVIGFLFGALFILFSFPYCKYKSCQVDAKIYNQKFGTSYTTADFFWSESTIKSFVGEGEQKTFNVNMKEK